MYKSFTRLLIKIIEKGLDIGHIEIMDKKIKRVEQTIPYGEEGDPYHKLKGEVLKYLKNEERTLGDVGILLRYLYEADQKYLHIYLGSIK